MYFNNVHILIYTLVAIIGLIVGKYVAWCNVRLPENKKVLSKEYFSNNKIGDNNNYIYMILIAIIYILLLRVYGIKTDDWIKNLELIKFLILTPMLVLTCSIDLKHRIIPNRLTLTMFELGIVFTFLYGMTNLNMVNDYLLGGMAGIIIFGIITLVGGWIAGKEAMGLGDVKFMGSVGLFFGLYSTLEITLLSFIIGSIISVIILVIRMIIKKKDEYIPFGPFLSVSSLICMFLSSGIIIDKFLEICRGISLYLFV